MPELDCLCAVFSSGADIVKETGRLAAEYAIEGKARTPTLSILH